MKRKKCDMQTRSNALDALSVFLVKRPYFLFLQEFQLMASVCKTAKEAVEKHYLGSAKFVCVNYTDTPPLIMKSIPGKYFAMTSFLDFKVEITAEDKLDFIRNLEYFFRDCGLNSSHKFVRRAKSFLVTGIVAMTFPRKVCFTMYENNLKFEHSYAYLSDEMAEGSRNVLRKLGWSNGKKVYFTFDLELIAATEGKISAPLSMVVVSHEFLGKKSRLTESMAREGRALLGFEHTKPGSTMTITTDIPRWKIRAIYCDIENDTLTLLQLMLHMKFNANGRRIHMTDVVKNALARRVGSIDEAIGWVAEDPKKCSV